MSESIPTNEQEFITLFFPNDNTKTISDVITYIHQHKVNNGWPTCTEVDVKKDIKLTWNFITDWSFNG